MEATAEGLIEKYKLSECINCAVCTGACPMSIKAGLNIRRIARRIFLRKEVYIPPENELWSCTTCSTCELRCPKELSPINLLINLRSIVIEEGKIPPTIKDALESVYKHGNPWGRSREKRSEWAEGQGIKHISQAEMLYFVGCTPSYDPRAQKVARAVTRVLRETETNFGILGNEESCCGDPVYGMGEMGLFEFLLEENLNLFEKYNVKHIVTSSPHCYDAFKNRYGKRAFEVQHYIQYFTELIDKGKLSLHRRVEKTVTFHDPCSLGKRNNIYDEPRKIIESIPDIKLVELDRSRERSLCCEGGGGRMWMDIPGRRLAEIRVVDAVDIGAEVLIVACPFCLSTLEDAVLTTGKEGLIQVMDLAELIAEVI